MADPVEPAASSPSGFHRVQRGETLSGLADAYGVTVKQLRSWNGLGAKGNIRSGQRLRVAPSSAGRSGSEVRSSSSISADSAARVHRVRRGETLSGLAKRYGVSVQSLRNANHLHSGDGLRAGATLRIPG
jgi:LysM repeat protein